MAEYFQMTFWYKMVALWYFFSICNPECIFSHKSGRISSFMSLVIRNVYVVTFFHNSAYFQMTFWYKVVTLWYFFSIYNPESTLFFVKKWEDNLDNAFHYIFGQYHEQQSSGKPVTKWWHFDIFSLHVIQNRLIF